MARNEKKNVLVLDTCRYGERHEGFQTGMNAHADGKKRDAFGSDPAAEEKDAGHKGRHTGTSTAHSPSPFLLHTSCRVSGATQRFDCTAERQAILQEEEENNGLL